MKLMTGESWKNSIPSCSSYYCYMAGYNSLRTLRRIGMGDTLWPSLVQAHSPDTQNEKYKIPSYLRDKLPPHRGPPYILNNSNTFLEIIRCKTARYKNIFFPDATSSWNNMIINFQDISTFTSIKSRLLSLTRPKIKSTFGIHDALGLRYLFQLRVNFTPLRSHKMRHNFSDTPSETCECNLGIEDIRHFLFECPFYAIQRVAIAVKVIDILQRKNLSYLWN